MKEQLISLSICVPLLQWTLIPTSDVFDMHEISIVDMAVQLKTRVQPLPETSCMSASA